LRDLYKVVGKDGKRDVLDKSTPSALPSSNPVYVPQLPSIVISALKMETVCFSETFSIADEAAWRKTSSTPKLIAYIIIY
jgi:hypothetical protein